jgi:CheY-like chemotaxis protein
VTIPVLPTLKLASRPTALLVDDNAINIRVLQMYCAKRGLPYHSATDGRQAVEIFSRCQSSSSSMSSSSSIQLIFMDLQMPVCNGIEATRQIRALETQHNWRRSTLFILTGQDSPADKTNAEGAGADEYFVKPVGIKVLDRSLKRHFPAFEVGGRKAEAVVGAPGVQGVPGLVDGERRASMSLVA